MPPDGYTSAQFFHCPLQLHQPYLLYISHPCFPDAFNKIQKTKIHAADLADDIIANQLRIVHEIASLLGETAAETKVAVHDLKEAIMLDEDSDDDA